MYQFVPAKIDDDAANITSDKNLTVLQLCDVDVLIALPFVAHPI